MKNSIRYSGILSGVLMVVILSGTLGVASAVNPWGIGAQTTTNLPTGTHDILADVTLPNLPALAARSAGTFIWMGGHTGGGSNIYLSQPEFRAYTGTEWRVHWEIVHGTIQDFYMQANMKCSPGAKVELYTAVFGDGSTVHQEASLVSGSCTLPSEFVQNSQHTYGNRFTEGLTILESYDSTASDFGPMNGQTKFTGFASSTDYVHFFTRALTFSRSVSPVPPACMSSVGGTGTDTITVNC